MLIGFASHFSYAVCFRLTATVPVASCHRSYRAPFADIADSRDAAEIDCCSDDLTDSRYSAEFETLPHCREISQSLMFPLIFTFCRARYEGWRDGAWHISRSASFEFPLFVKSLMTFVSALLYVPTRRLDDAYGFQMHSREHFMSAAKSSRRR